MVLLSVGEKMFIRFDRIHEREGQTQTDGHLMLWALHIVIKQPCFYIYNI